MFIYEYDPTIGMHFILAKSLLTNLLSIIQRILTGKQNGQVKLYYERNPFF